MLPCRALRHAQFFETDPVTHTAARVHHEPALLADHRHLLVAHLPEQVHRLARRLRQRRVELVRREPRLERPAQRILRLEEAVRRHETVDPLVRAEAVVVREEVAQPLARVGQLLRLSAVPEFAADRLPQALALAQRFRVMRARHDVLDAFAHEHALEFALAAPGEVLPALVGQHLTRLAVPRDPVHQGLDHPGAALRRGQAPAHHVAAEIVEEDDQVHARAVPAQHEARDVGLPQLARMRALEAPHLVRRA